jgi:ribosomal protein L7Ae-like RNA K-turn-binding protein
MTGLEGLLGLGYRSRRLSVGVDRVRRALQQDEVHCVVVAEDASERALEKVVRLARGKRIPLVVGPDAARLGQTVGKPPVMVVGVRERALAQGILGRAPHFERQEE